MNLILALYGRKWKRNAIRKNYNKMLSLNFGREILFYRFLKIKLVK